MAKTLFISDLHLSEDTPAIEAGFFAFLDREQDADALYILGDFFEVWVGDDDDSPQIQRVTAKLRNLTDRGVQLFLVRGNRDVAMGQDFADRVGATLLGDTTVIDLDGTQTLILHGDTLCTDDIEYQKLRALFHDPVWMADLMAKPIAERRAFARQLRETSQRESSNKPANIVDVNDDAVTDTMAANGVSRMIHGHTHRPARHKVPCGERIVLGDWGNTGWCVRAQDGAIELKEFPL